MASIGKTPTELAKELSEAMNQKIGEIPDWIKKSDLDKIEGQINELQNYSKGNTIACNCPPPDISKLDFSCENHKVKKVYLPKPDTSDSEYFYDDIGRQKRRKQGRQLKGKRKFGYK